MGLLVAAISAFRVEVLHRCQKVLQKVLQKS